MYTHDRARNIKDNQELTYKVFQPASLTNLAVVKDTTVYNYEDRQ